LFVNTGIGVIDSNFGGYMITLVSVGEDHASVINMNGELWTWGANHHGQCTSDSEIVTYPICPLDMKVSFVASGGNHTLALASNNTVYGWGNNQYGQLGLALEEFESFSSPKEIFYFKEKIVSWLGAGSHHSIALSIEGYAYAWGRNDRG
jgi:alpha-tubulin suppressor-like RCC1 family protein